MAGSSGARHHAVMNEHVVAPSSPRLAWTDLPPLVRAAVEAALGSPVVSAQSQLGGFSPGTADRVVCADGTRAFVKAVGASVNPQSPQLHRAEARVTAALPARTPAPRLLSSYDDGDWVALVLEDVDGRMPTLPWRRDELIRTLRALHDLATALTPCPLPEARRSFDVFRDDFASWRRIAAAPPDYLDGWALRHLERLAGIEAGIEAALAGDTLAHCDLRADNLLLTPDGGVVVVDWPWASTGPRWLDVVLLMPNVVLYGDHDPEALLSRHPLLDGAESHAVTTVAVALAGYFMWASRQPPSPGLPTLRAFQAAQGAATLRWLRRRTGWP